MGITWNHENYVKLLAAILAAHPEFKPDARAVAVYFGDGATYDAIQGCMKPIRKRAQQLRHEVETGLRPNIPPKPTPKKRNAGGSATPNPKGKKVYHDEDEVDDEELFTPAKKKAKMIEDGTPTPTPRIKAKNLGGKKVGSAGKAKGSSTPLVIDLLDSDDDNDDGDGLGAVEVKQEHRPSVMVKSETRMLSSHDDYSDDEYNE
ncbi:hypothetical protein TWF694_003979 [Orbilia ellipsospora]|uniref:Uncharacterized protein n=1 Tax=Orbilia ellipsospora TaxID=2528407 RepID=A0AAV9WXR6_9PEZI